MRDRKFTYGNQALCLGGPHQQGHRLYHCMQTLLQYCTYYRLGASGAVRRHKVSYARTGTAAGRADTHTDTQTDRFSQSIAD